MKIEENNWDSTKQVLWTFGVLFLILSVLTFFGSGPSWRNLPIAMIWGWCCLIVGIAIGFLFGIPKTLQSDKSGKGADADTKANAERADHVNYQLQINTNLTEISDWLTKIIIGLGLIELKELPGFFSSKANILASALEAYDPTNHYKAYSLAVILGHLIIGLLFGYLLTRLYLSQALADADRNALRDRDALVNKAEIAALKDKIGVVTAGLEQPFGLAKPQEDSPHKAQADLKQQQKQNEIEADKIQKTILDRAQKYDSFQSNDYSERVRTRDHYSDQMAIAINSSELYRAWVLEQINQGGSNGLIAGLASAINFRPIPGDTQRLLKAAQFARYKHCKFKVVTSFGTLFNVQLAGIPDIQDVLAVLSTYYHGDADGALKSAIRQTIAIMSARTGRSIGIIPA